METMIVDYCECNKVYYRLILGPQADLSSWTVATEPFTVITQIIYY